MEWLLVALGAAAVLVAVDRALNCTAIPPYQPFRRRLPAGTGAGGASGAFGDLVEVFQPNHQHVVAEQDRQRLEIRQSGSADPRGGIELDLERGVATMSSPDTLRARRQVPRRQPFLGSPDMTVRSELFVADHSDALARVDARDAGREPKPGTAALDLPGVGAIDLELLGEIAARAVHFGTGPLELEEVDLDHESLLELPSFLREVLVELGTAEDAELPSEVAAEWATDEDLGLTAAAALSKVTAIVALVTGAAESGRAVYLWTASA